MAHLLRLILLGVLCFGQSAFASIPFGGGMVWNLYGGGTTTSEAQAAASACAAAYSGMAYKDYTINSISGGSASLTCHYSDPPAYSWTRDVPSSMSGQTGSSSSCPANSTSNGSSCSCNAGFVEDASHTSCGAIVCTSPQVLNASGTGCYTPPTNDSRCQDAALLQSSAFGGGDTQIPGHIDPDNLCIPTDGNSSGVGCHATMGGTSVAYSLPDGTWVTEGRVTRTPGPGHTCVLGTGATMAEAPDKPNNTCLGGQPGTVNGTSVCIPFPPGTTAQTTSKNGSVGLNPQGLPESKSSTVSNVCTGNSCTTTTVTNTISGGSVSIVNGVPVVSGGTSSTTTESSSVSKADFCTAKPKDPQCGQIGSGESTFGGTCGTAPACSGDAIQCAIATAVFQTNCALSVPESSPEMDAYNAAKAKTGSQTGNLPGSESVDVGPTKFDQSNLLGAGVGMSDLVVTVHGQTLTLPLSSINQYLAILGRILQAVTFLICARIVMGNRSGG